MTPLTPKLDKAGKIIRTGVVVRESSERLDRRSIVVILGPGNLLGFRLKGTRRVFETTIGACASLAIKQHVASERARKAAARKSRKGL
jgi:hypothetical protein